MDANQVDRLRELLAPTGWLERTEELARMLRTRTRHPGGLLLVGTPTSEPWHLAAHLDEESRWNDLPELAPTLLRWAAPAGAPAHLRVGLDRLERAGRGETVFVVSPDTPPDPLLERVHDARRVGATIVALDGGDPDLTELAHGSLTVRAPRAPVSFAGAQHLISSAAGGAVRRPERGLRARLARFLDVVSGPVDG